MSFLIYEVTIAAAKLLCFNTSQALVLALADCYQALITYFE
jgi:hypothetical protein